MNNNSSFNVMDMAQEMANDDNAEIKDLFAKQPKSEDTVTTASISDNPVESDVNGGKKKPWSPDASLLDGMSEFSQGPLTYDKEELSGKENEDLKNIADDNAIQESREAMDELGRKNANIESAKKRHGIVKLQVPPGQFQASILAAAGDTNYKRAQAGIDEILNEIKEKFPEFILEWADDAKSNSLNNGVDTPDFHKNTAPNIQEIPEGAIPVNVDADKIVSEVKTSPNPDNGDLKIIIDKSQLPEVSWSQDEVDKIKKSRTVELNIIETKSIEYSQIEDVEENAVDAILAPYHRKSNDVVAVLPASKYRATVSGLSYTEVIDLSNSQEMNNLDGEKKKWSICFNHIHNQSIGPWEEYQWYNDPITKQRIKLPFTASIPPGIDPNIVHEVTKFQDFLQKTSFMDLEFILWKVLCATTMDKEIISIDCHAIKNGNECGKSYDWIYSPSDLLMIDSISKAVLDEMAQTGNASTKEDIIATYESSMLRTNNTVKLPSSGFSVVFGHISAYDYLTSIYAEIKAIEEAEENDPTLASRGMIFTTLTVIRSFLIPQEDGKYKKIKGTKALNKVVNMLDEIDWQTISELVRIMVEPYQFKFALRDIVCPQCNNRSIIQIENMTRLLFIVARSLSSVQVVLKRT